MNKVRLVLFFLILWAGNGIAQPVWSPAVRSEREMKWMKDSLQLKPELVNKVSELSLKFQQDMDKAAEQPHKAKHQKKLEQKKDAELKAILTKAQYTKYYRRELLIRKQAAVVYKGRQPM